ncbi:MAG: LysM peptidoglycan-binding domain-containing protein [Candidatus Scalindua sp.]|nr:LysM peptidoglycan-binding domain-containing protein [Candidatus Scalindua sp.]
MKRESRIGFALAAAALAVVAILHVMRVSENGHSAAVMNQAVCTENFIEESQIIQGFGMEERIELPIQFEVSKEGKGEEDESVSVHKAENRTEMVSEEGRVVEGEHETVVADPKKKIMHTVSSQDNLYNLSQKYYGDAKKWREIYEANKDLIEDPDILRVGDTLLIPDLSI